MDPSDIPTLAFLFLVVGALYASVGHAGASGYLAVMALLGVQAVVMRSTALSVNILVAAIAFVQFARAGHFSWRLFWPLALLAVPAAFAGAALPLSGRSLRLAIGAVLVVSALRMLGTAVRPTRSPREILPPAIPTSLAVGAGIGFVAGLTGTGGGIFLSPLMLLMGWADAKKTAGVSAAFILVNSIAGFSGIALDGWRPTADIGWLAVAACAGGAIGSHFGSRQFSGKTLRLVLSAVLLIAGVKLLLI